MEIAEVENPCDAYELLLQVNPLSVDDLLCVCAAIIPGPVDEAGRFSRSRKTVPTK